MDAKNIKTLEAIADLLGVAIESKSESELMELYDESLDEMDDIRIGSLTYNPATVLKEVDPTAYRCGFNDWLDSEGLEEIDGGWLSAGAMDVLKDDLCDAINGLD